MDITINMRQCVDCVNNAFQKHHVLVSRYVVCSKVQTFMQPNQKLLTLGISKTEKLINYTSTTASIHFISNS